MFFERNIRNLCGENINQNTIGSIAPLLNDGGNVEFENLMDISKLLSRCDIGEKTEAFADIIDSGSGHS